MYGVPIGEAARQSGVKVPTIRYYEQISLLAQAPRTVSNRRLYGKAEMERLKFIRHARELGFEIDAIRTLSDLQDKPDQSCAAADAIASARLGEVEQRIRSLMALKTELQRMITECRHGRAGDCRVIEILADHGRCLDDHGKVNGSSLEAG